jgi:hypothetical protein
MEACFMISKVTFILFVAMTFFGGGGGLAWYNINLAVNMSSPTSARALISMRLLHSNQVLHFSNSDVPATSVISNCYYAGLQQPAATSQPLCEAMSGQVN